MKTREALYRQEAAGILRDLSMYRALTEAQLLRLYPGRQDKVKNLLSYLVRQGRIRRVGETYFPAGQERITSAKASHRSGYGLIRSEWERGEDGRIAYVATVPANTTATLTTPPPSSFSPAARSTRSSGLPRARRSGSTAFWSTRKNTPPSSSSWWTTRSRSP